MAQFVVGNYIRNKVHTLQLWTVDDKMIEIVCSNIVAVQEHLGEHNGKSPVAEVFFWITKTSDMQDSQMLKVLVHAPYKTVREAWKIGSNLAAKRIAGGPSQRP